MYARHNLLYLCWPAPQLMGTSPMGHGQSYDAAGYHRKLGGHTRSSASLQHIQTRLHYHHLLISLKDQSSCFGLERFGHTILRIRCCKWPHSRHRVFQSCGCRRMELAKGKGSQYLYNAACKAGLETVGPVVDCYRSLLRIKPNVFFQLLINSRCCSGLEDVHVFENKIQFPCK